ncbi:hypothetical protein [Fictibacillus phosphorivorans]|uniref:hypothetical protein n=1 Tax=Fictibacillus phosphorivorans TaxID=1221500 RepID=UPI0011A194DD|nr:hypothetical protein [Fictibacillus phosphorivorans]
MFTGGECRSSGGGEQVIGGSEHISGGNSHFTGERVTKYKNTYRENHERKWYTSFIENHGLLIG